MKKKSPRDIPSFSRQAPGAKPQGARPGSDDAPHGRRAAPPPARAKPQATSSKSGKRGQ